VLFQTQRRRDNTTSVDLVLVDESVSLQEVLGGEGVATRGTQPARLLIFVALSFMIRVLRPRRKPLPAKVARQAGVLALMKNMHKKKKKRSTIQKV
jgi:hypothetical protein